MKRLLMTVFFVIFIPFLSFADEVDKGLTSGTSSRIKESTRQVIQIGVDPDAVIKMTQNMISDNFSEQQVVAGHELLIKAKKQNIDEEPIINKLHEGIAKNVTAENILQAMEKVRVRYELANAYTQNMKTDEQQAREMAKEMAECMAAGMDKNNMNKIMETLQAKTKNISKDEAFKLNEKTLETTRTLARSGVSPNDIVDVMNNALKSNYNSGQMEKLGSTFMTQARGASSASTLAKAYSDAIKNGATPEKLGSFNPQFQSPSGEFPGGAPTQADNAPAIGGGPSVLGNMSSPPAGAQGIARPLPSGNQPASSGVASPAGASGSTAPAGGPPPAPGGIEKK